MVVRLDYPDIRSPTAPNGSASNPLPPSGSAETSNATANRVPTGPRMSFSSKPSRKKKRRGRDTESLLAGPLPSGLLRSNQGRTTAASAVNTKPKEADAGDDAEAAEGRRLRPKKASTTPIKPTAPNDTISPYLQVPPSTYGPRRISSSGNTPLSPSPSSSSSTRKRSSGDDWESGQTSRTSRYGDIGLGNRPSVDGGSTGDAVYPGFPARFRFGSGFSVDVVGTHTGSRVSSLSFPGFPGNPGTPRPASDSTPLYPYPSHLAAEILYNPPVQYYGGDPHQPNQYQYHQQWQQGHPNEASFPPAYPPYQPPRDSRPQSSYSNPHHEAQRQSSRLANPRPQPHPELVPALLKEFEGDAGVASGSSR